MRNAIESIASALEKARPKRVLAISDYGAHVGFDIGMPTMCGTLETRIRRLKGHRVILRSAEHMQNWSRAIPGAVASGTLTSFPIPFRLGYGLFLLTPSEIEVGWSAFFGLVLIGAGNLKGNAVFAGLLLIVWIFACATDFSSSASVAA